MAQTVVGIFDSASDAQNAVNQLVSNGFSRSNIDVSSTTDGDMNTTGSMGSTSGTGGMSSSDLRDQPLGGSAETRRADAGMGSSSTADVSGNSGMSSSTLEDQPLGGNAQTRAEDARAFGGSTGYTDSTSRKEESGSSIGRFFSNLFGGDDDDTMTTRGNLTTVGEQNTVVTVHAMDTDEAERAADILDDFGAINIDERAEQYRSGNIGTGIQAAAGSMMDKVSDLGQNLKEGADQTLKVIEENLQVGKRTVETGGVRVRSRIVEKPVEESLRLREERVRIQRTPVNRMATDADMTAFQQGDITLTERSEVPVVSKETRVVEEISLGKDVTEREETIRDTVRSTEVDVENTTGTTDRTMSTGTTRTTNTDPGNM
jgi:uncharacterized protein (TIGR02271 family)